MKKDKNNIIIIVLMFIIIGVVAYLLLFGKKIEITSITLSEHNIKLFVGDSKKLDISILPENATDKTVTWESSSVDIASVTSDGVVKATSDGEVTITVKSQNGTVSDKCIVKILKTEADQLEFEEQDIDVHVNDSKELNISIIPSELKEYIKWTSSDENIVTVDNTGKINGVSKGKAVVKASYGTKEAEITVKVIVPVTTLEIEKDTTTINVGAEEQLKLNISPEEAADQEIKWESSDNTIVTVNNGLIKGIASGTATVKASIDGKEVTCKVTVAIPVTEIKLNKTTLSLKKGNSETLVATISPSDSTNKAITWKSSNEKVATVDNNGKVTGVGTGKATIEATIEGKTAKCTVNSIGYVITEDSKFTGSVVASHNSDTLKYRIIRTDSDYTLVWVMDAYLQWNSALPTLGTAYKAEDLLSKEISKYGYQKKGLVATNGGFFWDGWGDSPCVPFILNKGNIIRDIENKNYNKHVYGVLGMTKDSLLKTYSFSANDYAKNKKSRQEMLDDGVRNSFSVTGYVVSPEGKLASGNDHVNRTVLCQVDENNFVIYSGSQPFAQIAKSLKNTYNCRVAINFDGGGSRKLYYKTSTNEVKKVFGGGRAVPDMMYFVEQ